MSFTDVLAVFSLQALLLAASQPTIPPPDRNLHVYALPVGQGDATVIQCPAKTGGLIVVDMGSTTSNGYMTPPSVKTWLRRRSNRVDRVEAIFLTHRHADHFNFIDALSNNVKPGSVRIYHTCSANSYRGLYKKIKPWRAVWIRVQQCIANDKRCRVTLPQCRPSSISICNGRAAIRILAAELNACKGNGGNADSMVVKVEFAGQSVLLLGDLEDSTASLQLDVGGPYDTLVKCANVRSGIMRLAHHGAYGKANKVALHNAVNPYYVFSSSACKPRFLHPRCEIFKYYKTRLAKVADRHWYTCGDARSREYSSGEIMLPIYTTSVCKESQLWRNYILNFAITSGGRLNVSQTLFNQHSLE